MRSVSVPAYRVGRICLTGDAAGVATPFTGSGIFEAANNAIRLRGALDAYDDVDVALSAWSERETAAALEILELGRQFEDAFIRNPPDFAAMEPVEAAQWWARPCTLRGSRSRQVRRVVKQVARSGRQPLSDRPPGVEFSARKPSSDRP
jgi:2-polyprenyl-6-methoxyphenol hydroxylase-like FAD-dependent oxidoreductase